MASQVAEQHGGGFVWRAGVNFQLRTSFFTNCKPYSLPSTCTLTKLVIYSTFPPSCHPLSPGLISELHRWVTNTKEARAAPNNRKGRTEDPSSARDGSPRVLAGNISTRVTARVRNPVCVLPPAQINLV